MRAKREVPPTGRYEVDSPGRVEEVLRAYRLRHAAKITLAVLVSAIVAFVWHVDAGFFVGVICIVVMLKAPLQPFVDAWRLIAAVAFVAAVMVGIMFFLLPVRPAFLIASCLFLFLWLTYGPTRYGASYLLGAIIIEILLFEPVFSGPDALVSTMEHLVVGIVIAWIVMGVAELLIWPQSPRRTAQTMLALLFNHFASLVEALRTAADGDERARLEEISLRTFEQLLGVTRFVASKGLAEGHPRVVVLGELVFLKLQALRRGLSEGRLSELADNHPGDPHGTLDELARLFRSVSEGLVSGDLSSFDSKRVNHSIDALGAHASADEAMHQRIHTGEAFAPLMRSVVIATTRFAEEYQRVQEGGLPTATTNEILIADPRYAAAPTRSVPPERMKQAGRVVMITLVLMFLLVVFRLPGNTPVSFYAVVLGLASNTGRVRWWGESGIIGALIALVYGFLCILFISRVPQLGLFFPLYALGLFVSVYVAVGPDRNAFAGFQAALILPFILMIFNGPEWSLEASITRCVAIGLTAVVAYVLMRFAWPILPVREFKRATRDALVACAHSFPLRAEPDVPPEAHRTDAGTVTSAVEALECLAEDTGYLIGQDRPSAMLEVTAAVLDFGTELTALDKILRGDLSREFGPGSEFARKLLPRIAPEISAIRSALLRAARALESKAPQPVPIDLADARRNLIAKVDQLSREETAAGALLPGGRALLALFAGTLEGLTRSVERLGTAVATLPDDFGKTGPHSAPANPLASASTAQ